MNLKESLTCLSVAFHVKNNEMFPMNFMVLFFCYIIQEIQFIAVQDAGSMELVLQNRSVCESTIK